MVPSLPLCAANSQLAQTKAQNPLPARDGKLGTKNSSVSFRDDAKNAAKLRKYENEQQ